MRCVNEWLALSGSTAIIKAGSANGDEYGGRSA
jgi:hypothetical protein